MRPSTASTPFARRSSTEPKRTRRPRKDPASASSSTRRPSSGGRSARRWTTRRTGSPTRAWRTAGETRRRGK
eukprot:1529078-Heterocapsa_arctica.AAC.1